MMPQVAGRTHLALALCWLGLAFVGTKAAWAQDDWSLTREAPPAHARPKPRPSGSAPRQQHKPDLAERYVQTLLRDPSDAFALGRLRELSIARDGNLESLSTRLSREGERGSIDALEVLARLWLGERQVERAEQALEAALARASERPSLLLLRAQIELVRGDERAARAHYEAVRRLAARGRARQLAVEGLAELALRAGDLEQARALYEERARAEPGNRAAREAFARALVGHGRPREAAAAYLELADKLVGDPRAVVPALREAARSQLESGEPEAALATLRRAQRIRSPAARRELQELELSIYRRLERLPELAVLRETQADFAGAGAIWEALGDDARAKAALRLRIRQAPRDVDSRERLARVLARGGELSELKATYRELVRLAPGEPRYAVNLAQLLRDSGDRQGALSLLETVSARARGSASVHRALAELYGRWGEAELATRELAQLARLEPDEPAHVIALGEEALARGDRKQALALWQRLPRLYKNAAEGHLAQSQVLGDHDLLEEALASADRARELAPDRFDVHRQRAFVLERAGRYEQAETSWLLALRLSGALPAEQREARQHLLGIWRRQGMLASHLRDLEQRLRERPRDTEALWLLAEIYARDAKRAGREIVILERLLELAEGTDVDALKHEQRLEVLRALERAHGRRGDTAGVLAVLERAIVADPGAAAQHLARAVELSLETYQDEAALRYAERALTLRPNDAKTRKLVGDLYRRRQELAQAIAAYRLAAQLDPRDFDTRIALAQLETARGDLDQALSWWLAIVRGAPDDALVARAARAARELGRADEGPSAWGPSAEARRSALEDALQQASLAHAQRPIYRRLLIESYAEWFGPALELVERREPDAHARGTLDALARRALKPLIEALADTDPFQRATALGFLTALGAKAAGPALMALAEQQGGVSSERAQALVALGRIADSELVPRLRALHARCERRLTPFALWALVASEGTRSETLIAALEEPDAGVRALAILGLGARGVARAGVALRRLAHERNPVTRAAALWALYQVEPEVAREAADQPGATTSPLVALASMVARRAEPEALAEGLLSESKTVRAAAARLALHPGPDAAVRLEHVAPRWPFSARDYVSRWLERVLGPSASAPDLTRLNALWPALIERAREQLAGEPPAAAAALAALTLSPTGLVPDALLPLVPCFPETFARALAHDLSPALRALAARAPKLRTPALLHLLGHAAPESTRLLASALADPGDPAFPALLEALAGRRLPASKPLGNALLAAFERSPDWTIRLAIARALGTDVGTDRLTKEPIALVRAVAEAAHAGSPDSRCVGGSAN